MTQQNDSSTDSNPLVAGKHFENVHCLMLPLDQQTLLLPNAAVAEVIGYSEPEAISDAPPWLLGRLQWRDRAVPLISFELASGSTHVSHGKRIAVLNTLNNNHRVPYVAVVLQGIPKLRLVQPDSVVVDESRSEEKQSVASHLLVDGEPVVVPDIDDLEHRLDNLG